MSGTQTTNPPSAVFVTGALSDSEKADVRRFCGYPAYGAGPSGFQSWRFFQAYGTLEYRMSSMANTGTPNMAPAELQIVRQYLTTLYTLESAIPGAGANLDTDEAAVWVHNKDEVRDRTALFDSWRRRLAGFMGVPPGPDLGAAGITLVV